MVFPEAGPSLNKESRVQFLFKNIFSSESALIFVNSGVIDRLSIAIPWILSGKVYLAFWETCIFIGFNDVHE
jgi:hypothetical protein